MCYETHPSSTSPPRVSTKSRGVITCSRITLLAAWEQRIRQAEIKRQRDDVQVVLARHIAMSCLSRLNNNCFIYSEGNLDTQDL